MNKKEVTEIKKSFSDQSGLFTLERVLTAFVDADKNLRYHTVTSPVTMKVEESHLYYDTFKRVLSTSVGKNFIEYAFSATAYDIGAPQHILYQLLHTSLEDSQAVDDYLNHIISNMNYVGPYVINTAYCTYSVFKRDASGELDDCNEEVYRFLLTAFCPANTGDDGFVFDALNCTLVAKLNTELLVNKMPSDGFLYPVFSNRSSDINHVMYYTKSASKPNISIVEGVLGCTFVMSADNEKACFQNILKSVVGDDLDYMLIKTVNEKLQTILDETKSDTEIAVIDNNTLRYILKDAGVSEDRIQSLDPIYSKVCGTAPLTVANLVESKMVLSTSGIMVNVKSSFSDMIHAGVSSGRRCLIIDLDEPTIEVNGLPVTMH